MAIELQTFRAFVAGDIGNRKTVTVGSADKTQLAQTRYTDGRPLASRAIAQVETSQDNIYVRSQLLSAVRKALGGEDDAYFSQLQEKLLGISAAAPQADLKTASKELTVRDVRAALDGLDARLAQKAVKNCFDLQVTESFSALHDGKFSPRNLELVRGLLQKEYDRVVAKNPQVDLGTLTGPGSLYALLLDRCHLSTSNSILLATHALPPERAKAFLRACAVLVPMPKGSGFDKRLLSLGDRLEKITDFSPAGLLKLLYPEAKFPSGHIPKNVAELDVQQHNMLMQDLYDTVSPDINARFATALDPNEQRRQFGLINAVPMLFELGLSITEIREIMQDPTRLNPANFPASAFLMGVQGINGGLEESFKQMVKDLPRCPCTVSIPQPDGRPWTLPAASMIDKHPFAAIAQAQFRTAVEAFCGPRASESMKANIFQFMAQGAQFFDGICNKLMGLTGGTTGYHYAFASEPDGSVVVTRSVQWPHTFEIGLSIRFRPDGSQELTAPVSLRLNPNVTTQDMENEETRVLDQNKRRADDELNAYLEQHLYTPMKALLDGEIAEIQQQYPVVQNGRGMLEMRARNTLSIAVQKDTALRAHFLEQTPEDQRASLPGIKEKYLDKMVMNMTAYALQKQMLAEAETALRQAAGTESLSVDLRDLQSKIGYVTLEGMSMDEMRNRFQEIKESFVAGRTAAIAYVQNLQGVGDAFRATLLEEVVTRPRVGVEGLQIALELAQGLNLPPATRKHDPDSAKQTCYSIARTIKDRFASLDGEDYAAEQRGHMTSLVMLYLIDEHREEMQNLLKACTTESLQQMMNDFSDDPNPDLALYACRVIGVLQDELAIAAEA